MLVFVPYLLSAQESETQSDFMTWTTFDLKKDLNNWSLGTEIELREFGFFEKTQRLSAQLGIDYSLIKGVEIGASYAFMRFYDAKYDDYQTRNRYSLLLTGKLKSGRFAFTLREKAELTTKDESDRLKENGKVDLYRINPELIWRNRLKAEYDIKGFPLVPALLAETFYELNNPDGNQFEKVRYTLSLEYKLNKMHYLELYGHYNDEFIEGEADSYVLGLGYTIKL